MTTFTPVDLRTRTPNPTKCLAHPGDCASCAWGIVTPDSPSYQEGAPVPAGATPVPGSYRGDCGTIALVKLATGEIGAIRRGRFHEARTNTTAFRDYMPAMGLTEADLVTA